MLANSMEGTAMGDGTQLEQIGEPVCLAKRLEGVVIGALVGFAENGAPLVDFPGNLQDNPMPTRTTAFLSAEDVGREVALLFEDLDSSKPLLIGLIVPPTERAMQKVLVRRDGERLELTADREIVLRCGSASFTLTRSGKVLIRGAYVSSHSSGVNRIKGGSVQIN
jgi:Domain of unknown function (DUF6484)